MDHSIDRRSDSELLEAAASGDEEVFGIFCERMIPDLARVHEARCRRLGVPVDMADDFVSEALVRAVEWLNENRAAPLSRNWLMTVARNVLFDWIRHHRVERSLGGERIDELIDRKAPGSEPSAVLECFTKLAPRDREVLELVLLMGNTPAEAATILEIGAWSAYKRYERALKRLRILLQDPEQTHPARVRRASGPVE